jgi:hypothetical protein
MQIIPPETTNYLIAGYGVFFAVFILFIGSLALRWSRLTRDFLAFEELTKDKNS